MTYNCKLNFGCLVETSKSQLYCVSHGSSKVSKRSTTVENETCVQQARFLTCTNNCLHQKNFCYVTSKVFYCKHLCGEQTKYCRVSVGEGGGRGGGG